MWAALPLLCAGVCLLGAPARGAAELSVNSLEKFHFKSWMAKHHKTYSREEEYHQRLQTFASNWRKINAHNNGNHTFKMAVNQFSDMSFAEIKRKYLWSEPQNCSATKSNYLRGTGPYPPSVDWRKKGHFVSPVKNQGACGSCWTFSTTGALESAIAIATGKMLSLAEQQLVDCAQDFNNHGCQGYVPDQEGPKTSPHFPLIASTGSSVCRLCHRYTPTTAPGGGSMASDVQARSPHTAWSQLGQGRAGTRAQASVRSLLSHLALTPQRGQPHLPPRPLKAWPTELTEGAAPLNVIIQTRGRVDLSMNSLKFKPPQLVSPCEGEATVDQGWSSPGPALPAHSKQAARSLLTFCSDPSAPFMQSSGTVLRCLFLAHGVHKVRPWGALPGSPPPPWGPSVSQASPSELALPPPAGSCAAVK
uniref:Cathepsin H n=1 Tax=Callithrix jacchus TaxID=9483 RepID=A0A5F4WGC1_CALJA